jgi:hypothetical protein
MEYTKPSPLSRCARLFSTFCIESSVKTIFIFIFDTMCSDDARKLLKSQRVSSTPDRCDAKKAKSRCFAGNILIF